MPGPPQPPPGPPPAGSGQPPWSQRPQPSKTIEDRLRALECDQGDQVEVELARVKKQLEIEQKKRMSAELALEAANTLYFEQCSTLDSTKLTVLTLSADLAAVKAELDIALNHSESNKAAERQDNNMRFKI